MPQKHPSPFEVRNNSAFIFVFLVPVMFVELAKDGTREGERHGEREGEKRGKIGIER